MATNIEQMELGDVPITEQITRPIPLYKDGRFIKNIIWLLNALFLIFYFAYSYDNIPFYIKKWMPFNGYLREEWVVSDMAYIKQIVLAPLSIISVALFITLLASTVLMALDYHDYPDVELRYTNTPEYPRPRILKIVHIKKKKRPEERKRRKPFTAEMIGR
jgi:hypothetical protein